MFMRILQLIVDQCLVILNEWIHDRNQFKVCLD